MLRLLSVVLLVLLCCFTTTALAASSNNNTYHNQTSVCLPNVYEQAQFRCPVAAFHCQTIDKLCKEDPSCKCVEEYIFCIEFYASVIETRNSCEEAKRLYSSLVAVAAGTPYITSSLGDGCRTLGRCHDLECHCNGNFSIGAPGVLTPAPADGGEGGGTPSPNVIVLDTWVVTIALDMLVEDFKPKEFREAIVEYLNLNDIDQVVIKSVESGSTIVQFYFQDVSNVLLLVQKMSIVMETANAVSTKFKVLSVDYSIQSVMLTKPPETPSPSSRATPSPTSRRTTAPTESPKPAEDTTNAGAIVGIAIAAIFGTIILVGCAGFMAVTKKK